MSLSIPVELYMLALSTVWLFVLIIVAAASSSSQYTPGELLGNRDGLPAPTGFFARAKRAVDNHREGLILFAPFALILAVTDGFTATTALGAQLFFYSRIVHGLVYMIGVPYLRTLAWAVGIVGTGMVAWPIFF